MEPKMLVSEAAEAVGLTVQALHNQIKKKNLIHAKSKNRVYFSHSTAKSLLELKFKNQIICFQIVKGGTGKTSLCLSVGVRASLYGAKTLLIDLDSQGNLTTACRIKSQDKPVMVDIISDDLSIEEGIINVSEGLDILPSRIENVVLDNTLMLRRFPVDRVYQELLSPLRQKYDLIVVDCPPALGYSVAATALASDKVISPVTPSEFSLEGLEITSKELRDLQQKYKTKIKHSPILNEFDGRTTLSHDTLRFLASHKEFSKHMMRTVVRKNQIFENVLTERVSIFDSLLHSSAKEDVDLLTREILSIGVFSEPIEESLDKNKVKKEDLVV